MIYTTSLGADYYAAERDWLTPPRERDEEEYVRDYDYESDKPERG